MNDTVTPDQAGLFELASEQAGYFTTQQARACGFSKALLSHHARNGRFVRVRRGLYRVAQYPSSPREHVLAAWLAVGRDVAVVSHESALDLLGLSDVVPEKVHLTVPRTHRGRRRLAGVRLHTTRTPPLPEEVTVRQGVRVTAPGRTIADAAAAGVAPEHVEAAVWQSVQRGMVTRSQLETSARGKGARVERLILRALEKAGRQ